jgi:hypothetical protein
MLGFRGPAPTASRDAVNGGYGYLEVKCLGCNRTVVLTSADDDNPFHGGRALRQCGGMPSSEAN